jgi:hypothetical protein
MNQTILTDLVLPSETNPLNNLLVAIISPMDRAQVLQQDIPEELCSIIKSRGI